MMQTTPPWHFGNTIAGKTLDWLPPDTEENFKKLIEDPTHLEYFQAQRWLAPGAITYKINSHGFRSNEFDSGKRSIVALGCSYTIGIGLPLTDIWPTMVGEALDLEVYNLAYGGVGADTCYRLAEYWVPLLKPELVVMFAPPKSRIELLLDLNNLKAEVFLPSSESSLFSDKDIFLKNWFADEENANINNRKNKLAVQQLCANLGIQCLTYNAHDFMARSREEVGYARDYMHAGPRGHQLAFEKIIRDYYGR